MKTESEKQALRGAQLHRPSRIQPTGLGEPVRQALERYFASLEGCSPPSGLHELVISEVERPLIAMVMEKYGYNMARAANVLGINRATLSKRLKKYGLVD